MMKTLKIFPLKPRTRQRYSSGIQIVLEVLALAVRQKKRRRRRKGPPLGHKESATTERLNNSNPQAKE